MKFLIQYFKRKPLFCSIIVLSLFTFISWHKALQGTFLYGLAPGFLFALDSWSFPDLVSNHAVVFYVSLKLFGWNAMGWLATSLFFHIVASVLLFILLNLLTKNKFLSFISSAVFSVNVVYLDILSWGTYRALYAMLLCLFIGSCISFYYYKKTHRLIYYVALFPMIVFAVILRETGMLLPVFVLLFDAIFFTNPFKKTVQFVKVHIPLFLMIVLFIIVRHINGVSAPDYIDERSRLMIGLISNHQYGEYVWRVFLGFTKKIPAQIMPYMFVNTLKNSITFFPKTFMQSYFFSTLGTLIYSAFLYILYRYRKNPNIKLPLFFFRWMTVGSLFFPAFHTETDATLAQDYIWNHSGYMYLGFAGMSVFMTALAYLFMNLFTGDKRIEIRNGLVVFSLFWLIFQSVLVLKTTGDINKNVYASIKEFDSYMAERFKDKQTVHFYVFPYTAPLGDNLMAWNYYRSYSPEEYKQGHEWSTAFFSDLLEKVKQGTWEKDSIYFLDRYGDKPVIDRTDEAKEVLKEFAQESSHVTNKPFIDKLSVPIEIPQSVSFELSVNPTKYPDTPMNAFLLDWQDFVSTSSIQASSTRKYNPVNTFPHIKAENLNDANFGPMSYWEAEDTIDRKASITIDLFSEKEVSAVGWNTASVGVPGTYSIFSSRDNTQWVTVKEVQNNTNNSPVKKLEKSVIARYIRLDFMNTVDGAPPSLDEVIVITAQGSEVLNNYSNLKQLFTEALEYAGQEESQSPVVLANLVVTTKSPFREIKENIPILLQRDGKMHMVTIDLNDNEFNSIQEEFLQRRIIRVEIVLPPHVNYTLGQLSIKQRADVSVLFDSE
jgi:hypothetical protein